MNASGTSPPRVIIIHALVFSAGILSMLAGVATESGGLLLAAGVCLTLSGALIWVGSRIAFAGPAGELLRVVLGPPRVRGINLRAVLWIVAGVLTVLWGLAVLRSQRGDERPLQEPLVELRPA